MNSQGQIGWALAPRLAVVLSAICANWVNADPPNCPALTVPASTVVASAETRVESTERPRIVVAVDSIGMTVVDMERSLDFYTRVLSFQLVCDDQFGGDDYEYLYAIAKPRLRIAHLQLGNERLVLTQFLSPTGRPFPPDSRSNDRWFQHIAIVTNDMDDAYAHLQFHRVKAVSKGPQRLPDWNPVAGGIRAFYFQDPDGHVLEALQFPAGKGDPKWQKPTDRLFLGIDHTAIVVADTDASLTFYRDVLGMHVVGESTNYGLEQERLNNVVGARLRITSLNASAGPGIELLQYLSPGVGRPIPGDMRANDVAHWQTHLVTHNIPEAVRQLRASRTLVVSRIQRSTDGATYPIGVLVRDPDAHNLLVVQHENLAHTDAIPLDAK